MRGEKDLPALSFTFCRGWMDEGKKYKKKSLERDGCMDGGGRERRPVDPVERWWCCLLCWRLSGFFGFVLCICALGVDCCCLVLADMMLTNQN